MNLGHIFLLLAFSLVGLGVQLGVVLLSERLGRRWKWYKAHEEVYLMVLIDLALLATLYAAFRLGGWLS